MASTPAFANRSWVPSTLDRKPLREFWETPSTTASGLHLEPMTPRSGVGLGALVFEQVSG